MSEAIEHALNEFKRTEPGHADEADAALLELAALQARVDKDAAEIKRLQYELTDCNAEALALARGLKEAVMKSQERLCDLVEAETRLASAELSLRNHAPEVYKAHLEWCERGHAKPGPARMCSEVDETEGP